MTTSAESKHLKTVRRQLRRNLWAAYRGWWQWHKIVGRKSVDAQTAVILLPSCDRETNLLALLYLDTLLKNRQNKADAKFVREPVMKQAVLLTHDPVVQKAAGLFSDRITEVIPFDRKKAEDLMQFYCLYEFDKRFIVASIDEPNGRCGTALLGKRGTTKEEVFVIGVYRVYPFERPQLPDYTGDDPEIKEFLKAVDQL